MARVHAPLVSCEPSATERVVLDCLGAGALDPKVLLSERTLLAVADDFANDAAASAKWKDWRDALCAMIDREFVTDRAIRGYFILLAGKAATEPGDTEENMRRRCKALIDMGWTAGQEEKVWGAFVLTLVWVAAAEGPGMAASIVNLRCTEAWDIIRSYADGGPICTDVRPHYLPAIHEFLAGQRGGGMAKLEVDGKCYIRDTSGGVTCIDARAARMSRLAALDAIFQGNNHAAP